MNFMVKYWAPIVALGLSLMTFAVSQWRIGDQDRRLIVVEEAQKTFATREDLKEAIGLMRDGIREEMREVKANVQYLYQRELSKGGQPASAGGPAR